MANAKYLKVSDIERIKDKIDNRQFAFDEDLATSIGVVLLTYGDSHVKVDCISGEWSGVKGELQSIGEGIPLCPNGHPLLEVSNAPRLALIFEE